MPAKQRQDAKWSLPYIKDATEKANAEKLIVDLDAKDKAFDAALDKACNGLSPSACQGMRQELAAMGQSYDKQMDGQYDGTMGSVYKDGADKIAGQQWQYATADAKAQRDADVQRIAQNWGVSPGTAPALYDTMTAIHTTAAIGGAVYGMKTEPVAPAQSPTLPIRTAEKNVIAGDAEAGGWSQYDQYRNSTGSWDWPANNGAIPGTTSQSTIPIGSFLDRFGSEKGTFVSPSGVADRLRRVSVPLTYDTIFGHCWHLCAPSAPDKIQISEFSALKNN